MTPLERSLESLAPVLAAAAFLLGAAVVYGWKQRGRAAFHDEEMDGRDAGGLTTVGLRHFFAWLMRPLWQALAQARFPPDVITQLSLVIALGAGVAVAAGRFALGGWLFVASGLCDYLDGRVARATGRTTRFGAALDSVLDRYVEASLLVGLAWYYRKDWVLVPALLSITGSLLVPYVRARGEALAVKVENVGFMQRPERVALLGLGTTLSPTFELLVSQPAPHPRYSLAIATLLVLGVGAHVSAVQRLRRLLEFLGGGDAARTANQPLKTALGHSAATVVDFSVASALVAGWRVDAPLATITGYACGALVSFTLARQGAFRVAGGAPVQLGRYLFAFAGTAALNAGGVALLHLVNAPFLAAWLIARTVVFALWSYPVQRDFVFAAERRGFTASSQECFRMGRTHPGSAGGPR